MHSESSMSSDKQFGHKKVSVTQSQLASSAQMLQRRSTIDETTLNGRRTPNVYSEIGHQ